VGFAFKGNRCTPHVVAFAEAFELKGVTSLQRPSGGDVVFRCFVRRLQCPHLLAQLLQPPQGLLPTVVHEPHNRKKNQNKK
jgi:hypothetical protein